MPKEPTVTTAFTEDGRVLFGTNTRDGLAGVTGEMEQHSGRLRLTQLTFLAQRPATAEISATTLRALRLDTVLSQVRAQVVEKSAALAREASSSGDLEGVPADRARLVRQWRKIVAETAAGEKPAARRGDAHYQLVAAEYLRLIEEGKGGRGILGRLAIEMAKHLNEQAPRSRDNIRDWVAEARRRQFLAPGEPGRAGGSPGPRLYEQGER
jgi:hypothetical protein